MVSATIIQGAREPMEELRERVQRRLSLVQPSSVRSGSPQSDGARCRRVVYCVGKDQSVRAFHTRVRICQDAMVWLAPCGHRASLHLIVPEPPSPRLRHAFMQLLGDLSVASDSAMVSLRFEEQPFLRKVAPETRRVSPVQGIINGSNLPLIASSVSGE
jgi:hypothetical protein